MRTGFVAFVVAALVSTILTPLMRALARRLGVLDRPTEARKIHSQPVPRLGGLAILLGATAPFVGLYFYRNDLSVLVFADGRRIAALALATLLILAAGLLDDVRGLSQKLRFATEAVAGILVYWGGFRIDGLFLPLLGHVTLGPFALPLTVLWVLAVINALNFTDGLDGLAAGTSMIAAGTLFVLALHYRNFVPGAFAASIAGASFGFLLFNFHPATVYMGDTGSMFLGLALAVTAIGAGEKNAAVVAILGPLLALGLPIGDTVLRVIRRIILGQPWFPADRKHVHHRLLDLGLSHRNATLVLYGATAVFSGAALAIALASRWLAAGVAVFIVGCIVFAVRALGFAEFNRFGELRHRQISEDIERLTRAIDERLHALRFATDPDTLWQQAIELGGLLEIDRIEWTLGPGLAGGTRRWERGDVPPGLALVWTPQEKAAFVLNLPLDTGIVRVGVMVLTREPSRNLPFNGVERLAGRLWATQLATALHLLQPAAGARSA